MKKNLFIIFVIVLISIGIWFLFNENKSEETGKILENVTMVIKDGTLTKTSATVIITDLSGYDNTYGEGYGINKKDGNKWKSLETKTDKVVPSIGYKANENNKLKFDINWEYSYGELESGEYRLIKDVDVYRSGSYVGSGYVYTEFTIE